MRRVSGAAVSILIVNWNTRDQTLACLDSLPSGAGGVPYEVILVDNGSVDGSPEALNARDDITVLIENSDNRGFAEGVNQAAERAGAELLLLLNSDVTLDPGALATLVEYLEAHQDAAGAAPLYLNPDRSPQPFHFRHLSVPVALANISSVFARIFARRARDYRMLDVDFSLPQPVEQPSASCLLLRRSAMPPGPLLDEHYPIYFNDVDLARRITAHGQKLWLVPAATVVHEHGASGRLLGRGGTRQYVGALVRYLAANERRPIVLFVRALVVVQGAAKRLLRHPDAMSMRDVLRAAGGDPGYLPRAPRD
jgi:GT2 family glycosyltransferase